VIPKGLLPRFSGPRYLFFFIPFRLAYVPPADFLPILMLTNQHPNLTLTKSSRNPIKEQSEMEDDPGGHQWIGRSETAPARDFGKIR
jgi:hypothetical protein